MAVRILVVEDEFVIAASIKSLLTKLGYEVIDLIAKGEDAVRVAVEEEPDLILMDIALGGEIDGIEATRQIASRVNIPVIYLTAFSQSEILDRAKFTKPYGFLVKPPKERDLKVAIEMALHKHELEYQLQEKHQWLKSILSAFDGAVFATNTAGQIQFINSMASRWIGHEEEEVQGQALNEVVHLLDHHTQPRNLNNGQKKCSEGIIEMWKDPSIFLTADGKKIPVELQTNPVYSQPGAKQGQLFIFRDVTPFNQRQTELAEVREKFTHILDHSPAAILLCDEEGNCLDANITSCQALGYSRDNLLTGTLGTLEFDFETRPFHEQVEQAALSGPIHFEQIFQRNDGSTFPAVGIMGVWKKEERIIVFLIFRNRFSTDSMGFALTDDDADLKATFLDINHLLSQAQHLFKPADLLAPSRESELSSEKEFAHE